MLAPPVLDGAVQDSEIAASPAVSADKVGEPGTVDVAVGVAVCTADAVPVPIVFMADTLNQYAWPLVRLVKVLVIAVLPVLATATVNPAVALVVDCSIL
jgi:hypothetical protein